MKYVIKVRFFDGGSGRAECSTVRDANRIIRLNVARKDIADVSVCMSDGHEQAFKVRGVAVR